MIIRLYKQWCNLRRLKKKRNDIRMKEAAKKQAKAESKRNPLYILELTPYEEYHLMKHTFWPIPTMSRGGYYTYSSTFRTFDTKEEGEAAIERLLHEYHNPNA